MAEPTLFDEASLALIASGGAGKDGKVYSVKPVPVYGPELVTNGDFATDSDWNKTGGWTISGGTANCTGTGTSILRQTNAVPFNTKFYVSLEVKNYVSGTLQVKFAPTQQNLNVTGNGIYTLFTSGDNNINQDIQILSSNFVGSIDNVSVKEVLVADGDFTFTRGSNLSATRVDASQLIEKGRENLLLQSNQFDTTWTPASQGAIAGGQAGYDGSSDAWLLTAGAEYSRVQQSVSQSGVNTFSVYAKSGTEGGIFLRLNGGSNPRCFFDLNNGQVGNQAGDNIDASIESVGNGWYRCSLITNNNADGAQIYIANDNNGFVTSGNIYIQDAQLEVGLAATEYIESGATTAQAGILEDTPRFDYSGGATCPSLLLEPSRTNLLTQSEYFGSTLWTSGQSRDYTLTYTNELNPQGLAGSYKYKSTASNNQLAAITNNASGTTITNSIYVKRVSGTGNVLLRNVNNTATSFSLSISDGWKRIDVTATTTSITSRIYLNLDDVNDEILIWGAQQEIGSYATSYIPTYGSSQTRSGDACNKTNASGVIGQTEGTLYSEVAFTEDGTQSQWLSISDGTSQNWIFVGKDANDIRGYVRASNSVIFSNQDFLIVDNSFVKIAIAYKSGDVALYINGTKISSSTGSFSFNNTLDRINFKTHDSGLTNEKARYKQVLVFKEALSDTELIKLTTI